MGDSKAMITVAPYGGDSGNSYSFDGIKKIFPEHSGESLEAITMMNKSGEVQKIGGESGRKTSRNTIILDSPKVYLTGISGRVGDQDGYTVVKTITFFTNTNKKYGPYGPVNAGDTPFSFKLNSGEITGLHGISGDLVDSIGAYVQPVTRT